MLPCWQAAQQGGCPATGSLHHGQGGQCTVGGSVSGQDLRGTWDGKAGVVMCRSAQPSILRISCSRRQPCLGSRCSRAWSGECLHAADLDLMTIVRCT